ncbi:MAG: nuclear transport factor 2 family protein [Bacteroidota bacterium]
MTKEQFVRLIEQYKRAWEEKNADLAADLFTDDIEYPESPFDSPASGLEGLKRYWRQATAGQSDIHFSYSNMFLDGIRGALEWECMYRKTATGKRAALKGAMFFQFEGGRIKQFREYWHKREE